MALLNAKIEDAVAHSTSEGHPLHMSSLPFQGGGALAGVPLSAHKVRPHDVVELRPSKGDASQPAVASGIVHRC